MSWIVTISANWFSSLLVNEILDDKMIFDENKSHVIWVIQHKVSIQFPICFQHEANDKRMTSGKQLTQSEYELRDPEKSAPELSRDFWRNQATIHKLRLYLRRVFDPLKNICITIIDESFRLGLCIVESKLCITTAATHSFHSSCTRLCDNSVNESNLKRSMWSSYSGHQSNPI